VREAFMTFVGFDLHRRYITACALDATGEIIAEVR
jgi:predicted NBD/HSP70 family sugar kinase